jgi:hypothetical protein
MALATFDMSGLPVLSSMKRPAWPEEIRTLAGAVCTVSRRPTSKRAASLGELDRLARGILGDAGGRSSRSGPS